MKAYYDQQKEVDLGEYVISIKHMIQKKKGAVIQQRPIRRINWEENAQEIDRRARYFETESPKTMSKVFGSLQDFVRFFSRRNPSIFDFTSHFEEIEGSKDLDSLNLTIIPVVVRCLEFELMRPILKELEDPSLTAPKKKSLLKTKERHEGLISLFKKKFGSFEEFYGEILRAYTMSTSLYPNLNQYLRNESWIQIDNFLPYTFCLCKAFFRLKPPMKSKKDKKKTQVQALPQESKSVMLYRGTAFDEFSLSFYKSSPKCFSWYSVTSTSVKREVAEKFMYDSVHPQNKKYPVLFIIEVPIVKDESESEYLEWIDIHKYSAMPHEDEVILAPGSVFEIQETLTDQDEKTIIRLKLKSKIQSLAHEGLIMQGVLQSQMMTEKGMEIVSLEGEKLCETLRSLAGNKLIEEVEFCLCTFDKRSWRTMVEILPTLKRAEEIKFMSCVLNNVEGLTDVQECNFTRVEIFESNGFDEILVVQSEENSNWIPLRELKITFGEKVNDSSDEMDLKMFERLRSFKQLLSLTFDFSHYKKIISFRSSRFMFEGIKSLTQLTSLTLSFCAHNKITNDVVQNFASQVLKNLIQLTSLELKFSSCEDITDEGVKILAADGLRNLQLLTSLALNFNWCRQISDQGIHDLAKEGLRNLAQLRSLALKFEWCRQITNKGVHDLAFEGIKPLVQLTSLELNFGSFGDLTDEGVKSLAVEGLGDLELLTSLTLSFADNRKITNETLKVLASALSRRLTQLRSLSLNFAGCKSLTDLGVLDFASQSLGLLIQLTSLTLNFRYCTEIMLIDKIREQILKHKPHLRCFSNLNKQMQFAIDPNEKNMESQRIPFKSEKSILVLKRVLEKEKQLSSNKESQISNSENDDLDNLSCAPCCENFQRVQKSLKSYLLDLATSKVEEGKHPSDDLSSIFKISTGHICKFTTLALSFSLNKDVKNQGLRNLASEGLRNLTDLKSLTLEFASCKEITDKGLSSLACEGLKYLTQLTSLSLDFSWNKEIKDQGLKDLAFEGLRNLINLKSLTLKFGSCKEITDKGLSSLACEGLRYLTQLTFLSLDFSFCKIADGGLRSLIAEGLCNFKDLKSLTLNFKYYPVTDGALQILASVGLRKLIQLKSLDLNFSGCREITADGLNILQSQILEHLKGLTLFKLDLSECSQLTKETVSNIIKNYKYFGFVLEEKKKRPQNLKKSSVPIKLPSTIIVPE